MNNAYIALGYACNQRCSFCPCSKDDKLLKALTMQQIEEIMDSLADNNIDSVIISGGEPTVHSTFFDTVSYALLKNFKINILSNSELFSEPAFFENFSKIININSKNITVTTTIHSQIAKEHEAVNGSIGSFERSLTGLMNLAEIGVHVIVKHCITTQNYKDLKKFYMYIHDRLPLNISIQFCSIDYCGIGDKERDSQKIVFPELDPYFEEMFDCCIENENIGQKRNVYCINMPFCSVDPFYWNYFAEKPKAYNGYASPQKKGNSALSFGTDNIVGTFCDECQKCRAQCFCPGTYKTAFELFGDSIVKAYE